MKTFFLLFSKSSFPNLASKNESLPPPGVAFHRETVSNQRDDACLANSRHVGAKTTCLNTFDLFLWRCFPEVITVIVLIASWKKKTLFSIYIFRSFSEASSLTHWTWSLFVTHVFKVSQCVCLLVVCFLFFCTRLSLTNAQTLDWLKLRLPKNDFPNEACFAQMTSD